MYTLVYEIVYICNPNHGKISRKNQIADMDYTMNFGEMMEIIRSKSFNDSIQR